MKAELNIKGLDQLIADLKRLPDDLKREAAVIVQAQAEQMLVDVQRAFPLGPTGNLRSHIRIVLHSDAVGGVSAQVLATAQHAYIWEHGSKARAYTGQGRIKTRKNPPGWKVGKETGTMPAGNKFIPIAILRRRVMTAALVDIVERAGLTVTTLAA